MTQLTTIDTNNYAAMAKAMGMQMRDSTSKSSQSGYGYASTTHLSWVRRS